VNLPAFALAYPQFSAAAFTTSSVIRHLSLVGQEVLSIIISSSNPFVIAAATFFVMVKKYCHRG
jgi:hypothetical protein